MAETLLQKAQRLGIQPQGTNNPDVVNPIQAPQNIPQQGETLLQKAQRLGIQPEQNRNIVTTKQPLNVRGTTPQVTPGGDVAIGALKGAASTFVASPLQSASTLLGVSRLKNIEQYNPNIQTRNDEIIAKMNTLPKDSVEYARLRDEMRANISKQEQSSQKIQAQTKTAENLLNIGEDKQALSRTLLGGKLGENVFTPTNKEQKIGYTGEQIAEYLIPSKAITTTQRGVSEMLKIGAKESGAINKLINYGIKLGARTATEAVTAAGITMAQQRPEDVKRDATWAAAITGGAGLLAGSGRLFMNAARKIYQSAMKPSTAGVGGAQRAASVVETGLKEGIILTESGIEKTTKMIDDMESRLGEAIDKAQDANGWISTGYITSFVDDAKKLFQNIADVAESDRALSEIDKIVSNFRKAHGDIIPVKVAQDIKVATYQWLKKEYQSAASKIGTASTEANKSIARGLKEGIVDVAPIVGDINARLKKLYEFDVALEKSMGRGKNLNLLGLGTKALFAAGEASGNSVLKILSIANQVLGSPMSKSGSAIYLYRIGKLLEGLSPEAQAKLAKMPQVKALYERLIGKF